MFAIKVNNLQFNLILVVSDPIRSSGQTSNFFILGRFFNWWQYNFFNKEVFMPLKIVSHSLQDVLLVFTLVHQPLELHLPFKAFHLF